MDIFLAILSQPLYRLFIETSNWDAFEQWKNVSPATWAGAKEAMRIFLLPRYRAHVEAVKKWLPQPMDVPYPYPSMKGPLPTWPLYKREHYSLLGAVRGERQMPRSLFLWAVSCSLFPVPAVDIARAVDEMNNSRHVDGPTRVLYKIPGLFDVAGKYFSDTIRGCIRNPYWQSRWIDAANWSPLALLSSYTVMSYNYSCNMASPGNNHRFARALLAQFSAHVQNEYAAIAFLLFWGEHTTFETCVIDSTFFQLLTDLVAELVLNARGFDVHQGDYHILYNAWFRIAPDQYFDYEKMRKYERDTAWRTYEQARFRPDRVTFVPL